MRIKSRDLPRDFRARKARVPEPRAFRIALRRLRSTGNARLLCLRPDAERKATLDCAVGPGMGRAPAEPRRCALDTVCHRRMEFGYERDARGVHRAVDPV